MSWFCDVQWPWELSLLLLWKHVQVDETKAIHHFDNTYAAFRNKTSEVRKHYQIKTFPGDTKYGRYVHHFLFSPRNSCCFVTHFCCVLCNLQYFWFWLCFLFLLHVSVFPCVFCFCSTFLYLIVFSVFAVHLCICLCFLFLQCVSLFGCFLTLLWVFFFL